MRRDEICVQTELRLNGYFAKLDHWDEAAILRRGEALFETAKEKWAFPKNTPTKTVVDTARETESDDEDISSPSVFHATLEEFEKIAPAGLQLRGKAKNYRQVSVDGWPRSLHYEIIDGNDHIGVDLHVELALEHPAREPVLDMFDALESRAKKAFPGYAVRVQSRGTWRWLCVSLELDLPPEVIAQGMNRLVEATKEGVANALAAPEANPTNTEMAKH